MKYSRGHVLPKLCLTKDSARPGGTGLMGFDLCTIRSAGREVLTEVTG